jgi:Ni,Fe-hydrogenase III small subunit
MAPSALGNISKGNQVIEQFKQKICARKNRLAAAIIVLGAMTPGVAGATNIVSCAPTKMKVISQTTNTNRTTTSNVFSEIPATKTTIAQGGSASSCVIVDFSALVNAGGAAFLEVMLDGNLALPDYSQLIVSSASFEARSASFVFPSVAPGNHTLTFLFRSSSVGSAVNINRSNIIVHYAP